MAVSVNSVADRIVVKDRNRLRLVKAEEVDWVESEGNYVRVCSCPEQPG